MYKIIAKTLAESVKKVIRYIISETQREKLECLLLKVDFSQVYDCVNWNYLRHMFRRFGFRDRWCKWKKAMVFESSMLVLVNGSLMKDSYPRK